MILLAPIVPRNAEERGLLAAEIDGVPFLEERLIALSQGPHELALATDSTGAPEVKAAAARLGLACLEIPTPEAPNSADALGSQYLPHGAIQALRALQEARGLDNDTDLILVDYRNPFVTAALAAEAAATYNTREKTFLISVADIIDHPTQIDCYFEAVEFDVLALCDTAAHSAGLLPEPLRGAYLLTHPLPFFWRRFGVRGRPEQPLFIRSMLDANPLLEPLRGAVPNTSGDQDEPTCFHYETLDAARRLVPAGLRAERHGERLPLAGLSGLRDLNQAVCLALDGPDGVALFARAETVGRASLLRVVSLTLAASDATSPPHAPPFTVASETRVPLPPGRAYRRAFCNGVEYVGPLQVFPDNGARCFLALFTRAADQAYFDFSEPVDFDQNLWRFDHRKRLRVNAQTGNAIIGRQDFPDIVAVHSSLAVGKLADFLQLKENFYTLPRQGFPMPARRALLIASRLDFLKYKAIRRTLHDRHE